MNVQRGIKCFIDKRNKHRLELTDSSSSSSFSSSSFFFLLFSFRFSFSSECSNILSMFQFTIFVFLRLLVTCSRLPHTSPSFSFCFGVIKQEKGQRRPLRCFGIFEFLFGFPFRREYDFSFLLYNGPVHLLPCLQIFLSLQQTGPPPL